MVYAVSETRIEQQATMMNKGCKTLVLGSMKMLKMKMISIVAIAGLVLALAADTGNGAEITIYADDFSGSSGTDFKRGAVTWA